MIKKDLIYIIINQNQNAKKKQQKKFVNYENKYTCYNCFQNNIGTTGSTGPTGAQGIQGLPGPTVAPGTDVSFPHSLIFFMSTIIFTETQKYRRSRTISTNTKQQ